MPDVFVSYSRGDSVFVSRLVESIKSRGKDVWVDTEGIADGEVFPEAIKRAIEQSDAFVFVITPASVASSYCENEVEYAREMQKRIVPVLRDPVKDGELPVEIRDRNWVPFTDDAQFDASLERLLRALDTDLQAAKAHTRWLVKALEWDTEDREGSLLLRGAELGSAEAWLAASPEGADPAPTALQREYLLASRTAAARRQRTAMGASLAVALVSIGLLVFALISRGQAVSEGVSARAQALAAESQAELPDDPEISLILGMRAVREQATAQSLFALRAALDASPLERGLPTIDAPGTCGVNSGLSAAYSPDGRQIAEATCTGMLRLLDPATGTLLRSEHIAAQLSSIAYSPNGTLLAVGTGTGVMLLDPQTGAVRARLAGESTSAVAFSPNGDMIAAASPSGITLWRIEDRRARVLVRGPNAGDSMVFSHDGRLLIVGYEDASVHVYDLASGKLVHRILAIGDKHQPGYWPEVVALSPDGSELAVGYPTLESLNSSVSIYNTKTWVKQSDVMSLAEVEISALAFSPDGTRLAVGAEDGTAGVWSTASLEQLVAYDGPTAAVTAMAFAPDGQTLLAASNDGIARIWRPGGAAASFLTFPGRIDELALNGDTLDVLHETNTGEVLSSFHLPNDRPLQSLELRKYPGGIRISPDGRLLLAVEGEFPAKGPLSILSASTGRPIRKLAPAAVENEEWSQDGSRIALEEDGTYTTPGRTIILSLASGRTVTLQQANLCGANPSSLAFSRDERRIAGAGFCGYADVWNARTGRLLRQVAEGGEVSNVDLNPDGSRLLVSSWDSRATIWDVATGRPLVNLIGHTRGISNAAFNPSGSLVLTTGLDHTIRVWNAHTGQQLRVLTFTDNQEEFAFGSNGAQFVVGEEPPVANASSIVRVFDTCPACEDPHALLALAASHATKELTTLERTVIDEA